MQLSKSLLGQRLLATPPFRSADIQHLLAAVLCCAVLSCAVLCCAVLCHAVLCRAVL